MHISCFFLLYTINIFRKRPREAGPQQARGRGLSDRPVVVPEAVDIVLGVHGEGNAVQALTADDAAEAAGVVGLAQSLQDLRSGEEPVSQSAVSLSA